jgi:hypothetical protein
LAGVGGVEPLLSDELNGFVVDDEEPPQESDPDETIPTQVPPQYFMAVPSGQL